MGALSHYIEHGGTATTGVALIREHVAGMNVPRSLWVPFPLGRPLGSPDEPNFQRDVLRTSLELLETAEGPTVADYPHDAPGSQEDGSWACAVMLPEPEAVDEAEALSAQLIEEVRRLAPWHEETRRSRGRTSIGASGGGAGDVEAMASLLAEFATGGDPDPQAANGESPSWAHPMPALVKFAADDLRAFYHEAAVAQPGGRAPTDVDLNTWVFGQTLLGEVLQQAGDRFQSHEDPRVRGLVVGLIPAGWRRRPS